MKTIEEFIKANGITVAGVKRGTNPNMPDIDMDHWRVTLKHGDRKMMVPFSKGRGHNGVAPSAAEVLSCLASDSAGVAYASDFADWASDLGFEINSKSRKTYAACLDQSVKLHDFLGSELYEELLYHTGEPVVGTEREDVAQ